MCKFPYCNSTLAEECRKDLCYQREACVLQGRQAPALLLPFQYDILHPNWEHGTVRLLRAAFIFQI